MSDPTVPFLRYDSVVVRKDGTVEEWFVNGWNNLVGRVGGEAYNGVQGVLTGAAQLQAQIDAANAARIAADAALSAAASGGGSTASNSGIFSGGVSSGATWVTLLTVVITPGGAGGDYTISAFPDGYTSGHLSVENPAGGVFNGNWRIIEELTAGGTEYTLASGTFTFTYNPRIIEGGEGGAPITIPESWTVEFFNLPSGLLPASNSAQSDIRLEIQRASGTNEITAPGLSGAMSVTWTA